MVKIIVWPTSTNYALSRASNVCSTTVSARWAVWSRFGARLKSERTNWTWNGSFGCWATWAIEACWTFSAAFSLVENRVLLVCPFIADKAWLALFALVNEQILTWKTVFGGLTTGNCRCWALWTHVCRTALFWYTSSHRAIETFRTDTLNDFVVNVFAKETWRTWHNISWTKWTERSIWAGVLVTESFAFCAIVMLGTELARVDWGC